jgi:hypothetical protein
MEDEEKFQDATFNQLRLHFKEWAPVQPHFTHRYYDPRWTAFLVIDEIAISTLSNVPLEGGQKPRLVATRLKCCTG